MITGRDSEAEFAHSAVAIATAATDNALSVADLHAHLHLTSRLHDAWLTDALKAADAYFEQETGRALLTQEFDAFYDRFPSPDSAIELPRPPVTAVASVKYIDSAGVVQTWTASQYVIDTASERARIWEAYGFEWPCSRVIRHSVTIRFTSGYANAAAVPLEIKQALKLLIGHWFNNREAAVPFNVQEIPLGVQSLLANYVSKRFF